MPALLSIDDIPQTELVGRRVMVRIEQDSLSTVAFLSKSGARVVIAADNQLDDQRSRLSQLLGREVRKLEEWKGETGQRAVAHLPEGGITFIENLALEPGEQTADDAFARQLAQLCDIYCNDAFAVSNEIRASTVTVAKHTKLAVAGLAFAAELSLLETMLGGPEVPTLAVLGGELSTEKLLLAAEIARRSDHTLVAGRLLIPFLMAKGVLPGAAAASEEMVAIAERMTKEAQEDKRFISTPTDFAVLESRAFQRLSRGERFPHIPWRNVAEEKLTTDEIICDIGTVTRWHWSDLLAEFRRIFWHGPLGISEIDVFCEGSRFLASQLVDHTWQGFHRTVVCGHSLVAGLRRIGFRTERIRHLTTAGQMALHYFAGRPLPAVEVLNNVVEARREPYRVLIPLNGSESDTYAVHAAAETVADNAKVFLLNVRSGVDEEERPDFIAALTDTEKVQRRAESERIFAEANGILAARGLVSANQVTAQGKPNTVISRYGSRIGARLIVMTGDNHAIRKSTAACAILIARGSAVRKRNKTRPGFEPAAEKLGLDQLPIENLHGKRVFVRIDADAEVTRSGALKDVDKLRVCLPTLEYLNSAGARVVIATHLGDPAGKAVDLLRLDAVAEALSALMGKPIHKLNGVIGENVLRAITDMKDGELVLLENLRFYAGEDANDPHFALRLAELCDIYCNDSFALAHRATASTVAITRHVTPAAAGLSLSRELTMFEAVLAKPERPFFGMIAGARIEEKLPVLQNLLPQLDFLFIGGALAFTFLKAKRYEVGSARVDQAFLPLVEDFLANAKKHGTEVVLPTDFVVVDADSLHAVEKAGRWISPPEIRNVGDNEIMPSDLPVDIGPATLDRIQNLVKRAHTILWNGPLGIAEIEPFAAGTRQVALALLDEETRRAQRTIICGDSLSRALRSSDVPVEQIRHMSTGGQSALALLAGHPLPAVAALDDATDAGRRSQQRLRTLLLAVDNSEHSLEAVRRIGEFVDAEGVEITLLHVRTPQGRNEAERVFNTVNAALARQGLISHRQLIADGKPATEILR